MNKFRTYPVLVVGAGIMGAGIAQVAAQAGHPVRLFDARAGAAAAARDKLLGTWQSLVAKGRMAADEADAALARITPVAALADAADAAFVVEAIVEQLEAKQALLRELEALVAPDAILASNTSSISITALANGMKMPGRVVGMHFFNPVALMKLVEVVSGLHTEPGVARQVAELAQAWGKVPVHAKSTPGFIVNRIARPYYAETLALLQEQAAQPAELDACLRGAGFRMGPCELMDLIGHDTNFSVTESVYRANFFDKRYQPSLVQREMVDGGLLGRKSGRGFYVHAGAPTVPPAPAPASASASAPAPVFSADARPAAASLPGALTWYLGADAGRAVAAFGRHWVAALKAAGVAVEQVEGAAFTGWADGTRQLALTDGRTATQRAADEGTPDLAVFDLPIDAEGALGASSSSGAIPGALAYAVAHGCGEEWAALAVRLMANAGVTPMRMDDAPGLAVARTVAMLINEAADAVQQAVCSEEGADQAMKLGVNYPAGPFEWLARWDGRAVVGVIEALDAACRGERYRVSPWLRRRFPRARAHRPGSER